MKVLVVFDTCWEPISTTREQVLKHYHKLGQVLAEEESNSIVPEEEIEELKDDIKNKMQIYDIKNKMQIYRGSDDK